MTVDRLWWLDYRPSKDEREEVHMLEHPKVISLTLEAIDELSSRSLDDGLPIARWCIITPMLAANLLEQRNINNRRMKPANVKKYTKRMPTWAPNGETIKFDRAGLMVDGQNRMQSCINAQVAFPTLAVFGVNRAYFDTMDQGGPRTGADFLKVEDCPNDKRVESIIRGVKYMEKGVPERYVISAQEILELYRTEFDHELLQESVRASDSIYRQFGHSPATIGTLYYLFASRDRMTAQRFFEFWAQGHAKVSKLQDKLARVKADFAGARVKETTPMAIIIQAWNQFRRGKRVVLAQLDYVVGKPFPRYI